LTRLSWPSMSSIARIRVYALASSPILGALVHNSVLPYIVRKKTGEWKRDPRFEYTLANDIFAKLTPLRPFLMVGRTANLHQRGWKCLLC
jgi:hypothetical protein